ncbi:MAG: NHL repeat-containing protein [Planctomycetota bacterium]
MLIAATLCSQTFGGILYSVRLSDVPNPTNNTSTITTIDTQTGVETIFFSQGNTYLSGAGVASDGSLFVGDLLNDQVLRFDRSGNMSVFATGISGRGFAFAANGDVFVSDVVRNEIKRFTADGTSQTTIASGLSQPAELGFDSAGNLFFSSVFSDSIEQISPSGTLSTFATGLDHPEGLAISMSGDIFVANQGNGINPSAIIRFDQAGNRTTFTTALLDATRGLEFDDAGFLYAANADGSISRYDASGNGSIFASGGDTVVSLAFSSAAVPEPSTLAVLGVFAALAACVVHRRKFANTIKE